MNKTTERGDAALRVTDEMVEAAVVEWLMGKAHDYWNDYTPGQRRILCREFRPAVVAALATQPTGDAELQGLHRCKKCGWFDGDQLCSSVDHTLPLGDAALRQLLSDTDERVLESSHEISGGNEEYYRSVREVLRAALLVGDAEWDGMNPPLRGFLNMLVRRHIALAAQPTGGAETPEHCCGVRGFAESGDKCPGCQYDESARPTPGADDGN